MKILDYFRPLSFGGVFGFFIYIYIRAIWDVDMNEWEKVGIGFSIGGVFLAGYIALWAFENENRRRRHEKDENKYYKLTVHDNLANLMILFNIIFNWMEPWPTNTNQRNVLCQTIIDNLTRRRHFILEICNQLQILNFNSYIPPNVKDQIYLIITQTKKVVSEIPTINSIPGYYGIVNDVFTRFQNFEKSDYMNDMEQLRNEFGSDVLLDVSSPWP